MHSYVSYVMAASRKALFKAMAVQSSKPSDRNSGQPKRAPLKGAFGRMSASPAHSSSQPTTEVCRNPARALTAGLIEEQRSKIQLANNSLACKKKRKYNSARRKLKAKSNRKTGRDFKQSRGDPCRVQGLVGRSCCDCSHETCFIQFAAIVADLVQLLSLFACQCKKVRDSILQECVGIEGIIVLGFNLSLKCFRKLFQLGKMQLAKFRRGDAVIDRRLQGNPSLPRVAAQNAKVRAYLVGLYVRAWDVEQVKFDLKLKDFVCLIFWEFLKVQKPQLAFK